MEIEINGRCDDRICRLLCTSSFFFFWPGIFLLSCLSTWWMRCDFAEGRIAETGERQEVNCWRELEASF